MRSLLLTGDCRDVMRFCMGEQEVQTCITSPPYFGLRSYDEQAVCIDPNLPAEKQAWLLAELTRRGVRARG